MRSLFSIAATVVAGAVLAQAGTVTRASLAFNGAQANDECGSGGSAISADGRYVAFESRAVNLVASPYPHVGNIFARYRVAGTTELMSVEAVGAELYAGDSMYPAINADGRYVAFSSVSQNLVLNDTDGVSDIFVRDRIVQGTERVSVSSTGAQADDASYWAALSPDGRFVVFWSYATNLVPGLSNGSTQTYVRDRLLGTTTRVSVSQSGALGNGNSYSGGISGDGRYIVFHSAASNLATNDANSRIDILLKDMQSGAVECESVSTSGEQSNMASYRPRITPDGRYVVYESYGNNLVPVDTNNNCDIFVRDRVNHTTECASVNWNGVPGTPEVGYGSIVASISEDGRFVGFASDCNDLTAGDFNQRVDSFLRDRATGTTIRASRIAVGQTNGDSYGGQVSGDGRFIAFPSSASNLISGDSNMCDDMFVYENTSTYRTVSGTVVFEGLSASAANLSPVSMRVTYAGALFGTYDVAVSAIGSLSVSLPSGALTVSIKPTHWLRVTLPVDTSTGGVSEVFFDLNNGDATNDNTVNLLDLSTVLSNWGGAGPDGDLDNDNLVTLFDLSLVLAGFGLTGDS